jgi:hypothetical protein
LKRLVVDDHPLIRQAVQVRWIGRQRGLQSDTLHETVALVDQRLARNRAKRREAPNAEALVSVG